MSPAHNNFILAIPKESGNAYYLQVNLYKPNGRHPKLDKAFGTSLVLNAGQNYSLRLTPSKLNEVKKTGIELKQTSPISTVALIKGRVINTIIKSGFPLSLEQVEDGATVSTGSFQTDSEGQFTIPVSVKREGFYYLSSLRCRVRIYLKPADKLQLNFDQKTGTLNFIDGSPENKILYQWQQLILPITSYGYNLSVANVDSLNLDTYTDTYK